VILRMKSLGLGDVVHFPFLAPSGRAIADGYQLLAELGAVDDHGHLLPMGKELSRLPLDPRVGRMILEARERRALAEVLVIASALSVQDVRDRPMEAQQQADQACQVRRREKRIQRLSASVVAVGCARRQGRGQEPQGDGGAARACGQAQCAQPGLRPSVSVPAVRSSKARLRSGWRCSTPPSRPNMHEATHKISNRQWEQLLRQNFINIRRVREWRDIHSQLLTVVKEQKWLLNNEAAGYEAVHLSMLSGCWAISATRPRRARATWARTASSSTRIPART
jgi:ATP-dependent helicase HrpA